MKDKAAIIADIRMTDAIYIAQLTGELAVIARSHGFNTLGFLLDMAKLEAEREQASNRRAP